MIVSKSCNNIMIREIEVCPPIGLRRWLKNKRHIHTFVDKFASIIKKLMLYQLLTIWQYDLAISSYTSSLNYLIARYKP